MAYIIETLMQAFSILNPLLLVVMVVGDAAALQYHYNHTGRKKASNMAIPMSMMWAIGWGNYLINKFSPLCFPMTVVCGIATGIMAAVALKQARVEMAKEDAERARAASKGKALASPTRPRPEYRRQPSRPYNARYQSHKKYLPPRR